MELKVYKTYYQHNMIKNSIDNKFYRTLMIRKDSFIKFLKENKLKIVWTVLGEKQVMGGRSFGNEFDGRLEINGVYYLEEDKINGKLTTKKI